MVHYSIYKHKVRLWSWFYRQTNNCAFCVLYIQNKHINTEKNQINSVYFSMSLMYSRPIYVIQKEPLRVYWQQDFTIISQNLFSTLQIDSSHIVKTTMCSILASREDTEVKNNI